MMSSTFWSAVRTIAGPATGRIQRNHPRIAARPAAPSAGHRHDTPRRTGVRAGRTVSTSFHLRASLIHAFTRLRLSYTRGASRM